MTALADYLRIRRGEGVKFEKIGLALEHFVEFLEERGAERVTVELAVDWATLPTRGERYASREPADDGPRVRRLPARA